MEAISRKEAQEKGLQFYFTGNPCKRGHRAKRYVGWGGCVECKREDNAAVDPEKERERYRRRRAANVEKARESVHRSHAKNPHVAAERNIRTALKRLGRDPAAQMPKLSRSEQGFMKRLYLERNRLNAFEASLPKSERMTAQWEVDHILPLSKGGRHVPSNLQIVPNAVNLAKKDPAIEEQHKQWALFFRFMERRGTLQKWIEAQEIVELDEAA